MKPVANKAYFFVIPYFLLLFMLVVYRVTIGVDLSDESYYTTFIDGWFKFGLGHSPNLMLHQTADWLAYPFAYFYYWLIGSNTGIVLFLRCLYVIFSFLAMLCFFNLSKRITPVLVAALTSGVVFLFMPWSLPTLSYNTIGMLGMLMALCLFAIVILDLEKTMHLRAFLGSCFLWSVAIIAYPTLLIALFFFLSTSYLFLTSQKEGFLLRQYAVGCFLSISLLSLLLVFTLGLHHLYEMLFFTNAVNHVSDGFNRKFTMISHFFSENNWFFIFSVIALVMGVVKAFFYQKHWVTWLNYLFLATLAYFCITFQNRVLFLNSHDFIFILTAFGIYIPIQTIRYRTYPSIIAIIYCTSVLAGLITTATAYNSLYNYHIGGFLAACLSLLFITPSSFLLLRRYYLMTLGLLMSATTVMIASDYRSIYGEPNNPLELPAVRVSSGVFSGLRTSMLKENIVYNIHHFLPQHTFDKSLAVIGINSGAYLLTSLRPQTLVTWSWDAISDKAVEETIHNHYQIKKNKPDYIFRLIDRWSVPLNQTQQHLMIHYHLLKELKLPEMTLQLYILIEDSRPDVSPRIFMQR